MADLPSRTVLLIEPEAPLRRLIALGLQAREIRVVATDPQRWPARSSDCQPALLIVDIDTGRWQDASLLQAVRSQPRFAGTAIIVLSWEAPSFPLDEHMLYVRKPFDARFLHALIEEQLATRLVEAEGAAAHQASLCPLMTAAGLLLIIVGLMAQLVIAGIGLAIALAALLCWTLGWQPCPYRPSSWLQPSHPCHV
ncbi:hypothetical protein [Thermogemmatispora sp.]|uniref:hypothetical protein n=1 Tax=Thermogemmatispora sp. TaxID=1968838 RepID=UPI0035E3FF4B